MLYTVSSQIHQPVFCTSKTASSSPLPQYISRILIFSTIALPLAFLSGKKIYIERASSLMVASSITLGVSFLPKLIISRFKEPPTNTVKIHPPLPPLIIPASPLPESPFPSPYESPSSASSGISFFPPSVPPTPQFKRIDEKELSYRDSFFRRIKSIPLTELLEQLSYYAKQHYIYSTEGSFDQYAHQELINELSQRFRTISFEGLTALCSTLLDLEINISKTCYQGLVLETISALKRVLPESSLESISKDNLLVLSHFISRDVSLAEQAIEQCKKRIPKVSPLEESYSDSTYLSYACDVKELKTQFTPLLMITYRLFHSQPCNFIELCRRNTCPSLREMVYVSNLLYWELLCDNYCPSLHIPEDILVLRFAKTFESCLSRPEDVAVFIFDFFNIQSDLPYKEQPRYLNFIHRIFSNLPLGSIQPHLASFSEKSPSFKLRLEVYNKKFSHTQL